MTNITDQLPYELCDGVVAMVEGLISPKQKKHKIFTTFGLFTELRNTEPPTSRYQKYESFCSWPDVAKALRFKDGEPAIGLWEDDQSLIWEIIPSTPYFALPGGEYLHRNACLFFDDAEAFRVLYQCIKEFGDARD